jgi:hypothetical protein
VEQDGFFGHEVGVEGRSIKELLPGFLILYLFFFFASPNFSPTFSSTSISFSYFWIYPSSMA